MKYVRTLNQVQYSEPGVYGGRACDLSRLMADRLPVPQTFVLTADAWDAFIQKNGIQYKIDFILQQVDVKNERTLQNAYNSIRKLITAHPIPEDVLAELRDAYESLGTGAALNELMKEDNAPFAIMIASPTYVAEAESYEGIIQNIRGIEQVTHALKEIYAMAFTPDAITYRVNLGVRKFRVATIVQSMPAARASATAYSTDPEQQDMVFVQSYLGYADLRDLITKDFFHVKKEFLNVAAAQVVEQSKIIVRSEDGHLTPTEFHDGRGQSLNDKEVQEVARLAKKAERVLQNPAKVFFSIDDKYFLLFVNKYHVKASAPVIAPVPEVTEQVEEPREEAAVEESTREPAEEQVAEEAVEETARESPEAYAAAGLGTASVAEAAELSPAEELAELEDDYDDRSEPDVQEAVVEDTSADEEGLDDEPESHDEPDATDYEDVQANQELGDEDTDLGASDDSVEDVREGSKDTIVEKYDSDETEDDEDDDLEDDSDEEYDKDDDDEEYEDEDDDSEDDDSDEDSDEEYEDDSEDDNEEYEDDDDDSEEDDSDEDDEDYEDDETEEDDDELEDEDDSDEEYEDDDETDEDGDDPEDDSDEDDKDYEDDETEEDDDSEDDDSDEEYEDEDDDSDDETDEDDDDSEEDDVDEEYEDDDEESDDETDDETDEDDEDELEDEDSEEDSDEEYEDDDEESDDDDYEDDDGSEENDSDDELEDEDSEDDETEEDDSDEEYEDDEREDSEPAEHEPRDAHPNEEQPAEPAGDTTPETREMINNSMRLIYKELKKKYEAAGETAPDMISELIQQGTQKGIFTIEGLPDLIDIKKKARRKKPLTEHEKNLVLTITNQLME